MADQTSLINKWKAAFEPLFGQNAASPNWNLNQKFDLSGNKELDIFDASQFATDPDKYYNQIFNQSYDFPETPAPVATPSTVGVDVPTGASNPESPTTFTRDELRGLLQDELSSLNTRRSFDQGVSNTRLGQGDLFKPAINAATEKVNTPFQFSDPLSTLNQSLVSSGTSALNRANSGNDIMNRYFEQAQPLFDYQNFQQQRALDDLYNQTAATGGILKAQSPVFMDFAGEQVLEPFDLQRQQLLSNIGTTGLQLSLQEEQALRDFAQQASTAAQAGELSQSGEQRASLEQLAKTLASGASVDLADRAEERMRQGTMSADDLSALELLRGFSQDISGLYGSEADRAIGAEQFQDLLLQDYLKSAMEQGTLSDIFGDYFSGANSGSGTGNTTNPYAGGIWTDPQGNIHDYRYDDAGQAINPGAGGGDAGGNRGDGTYVPPIVQPTAPGNAGNMIEDLMRQYPDADFEEILALIKSGGQTGARPRA